MSDTKVITVEAPGARSIFERWIARGDSIGVFRNHDLSHPAVGHTLFLPLDAEDIDKVQIGKTHAPDGQHGLGWRYLLDSIETSLDAFEFVEVNDG